MSLVPSLERLQRELGGTFHLAGPWQGELPAELMELHQGVPMDEHHQCYHAVFALPPGVQLPQLACTVRCGEDAWPWLLLTPARPAADGRQRMQTVFHCSISQPPSPPGAGG